jgi:hypothetical protein
VRHKGSNLSTVSGKRHWYTPLEPVGMAWNGRAEHSAGGRGDAPFGARGVGRGNGVVIRAVRPKMTRRPATVDSRLQSCSSTLLLPARRVRFFRFYFNLILCEIPLIVVFTVEHGLMVGREKAEECWSGEWGLQESGKPFNRGTRVDSIRRAGGQEKKFPGFYFFSPSPRLCVKIGV